MISKIESVTIYSADAKELADFYKEKVGLEVTMEAEMGEGMDVFEFGLGEGILRIIGDPKIGGSGDGRVIFNFEVDDIEKEDERLLKAKVKKTGDIHHVEGYGYAATFEDLDGNYFQLVQVRANG